MKAIILAAGRGTRLLPLTKNTPKPLLDIGEGQTIIENQLNAIIDCGNISEVIYVIGYRAEQVEAKMRAYNNIPVKYLYNPFYETTNNFISIWMAIHEMTEDFVIINGDDIFKPNVLRGLLDEPNENNITLVTSKKDQYAEEDMKVTCKDSHLLKVSKDIPVKEATGESIGMMRFVDKGVKIMLDTINSMVRDEETKNLFYLAVIQKIIDSGIPVFHCECSNSDWAEIDFHPDLNFIRNNFKDKFNHFGKN